MLLVIATALVVAVFIAFRMVLLDLAEIFVTLNFIRGEIGRLNIAIEKQQAPMVPADLKADEQPATIEVESEPVLLANLHQAVDERER